MEHLQPSELQKLLEDESTTLHVMQSKIANQIHLLQMEEELFRQELEKLQSTDESGAQGVNGIIEITSLDGEGRANDAVAKPNNDVEGAKNIVEIANEESVHGDAEVVGIQQENPPEGVNQIVEITDDEDEIMKEINREGYGGALSSSLTWPEQPDSSNLEYEIFEPSSDGDDSETEVEEIFTVQKLMSATDSPRKGTREKRQRDIETTRNDGDFMEIGDESDDQASPAMSPSRSPPRKKQTPRRMPLRPGVDFTQLENGT